MVLRPGTVSRLLEVLREMLRRLEAHRTLSLDAFLADIDAQDLVLRRLEVAVSCVLDVAAHILASDFAASPESYDETIAALPRHGVMDPDLGARLARLGGFRNVLVHAYAAVDLARVHELLARRLPDLVDFALAIEAYLARRPTGPEAGGLTAARA